MRLDRLIVLASCALAAACGDSTTAPAGVITGRWGGRAIELRASPERVQVWTACGLTLVGPPIVPEGSGLFVVGLNPVGPRRSPGSMTLRGTVSGSSMTFDAISITLSGTYTMAYHVERGAPGDFSDITCAL